MSILDRDRSGGGDEEDFDERDREEDLENGSDREEPDSPGGGEESEEELEKRARALGWVPESEWRDDGKAKRPKHFKTAREYLEDGNNNPLVMRERLRRAEETNRENAELRARVDDLTKLTSSLHERIKTVGKAGYEKARRELEAKREAAIEDADKDAFKAVDAEIAELDKQQKELEEATPAPKADDGKPKIDPYAREWVTANKHWYAGSRAAWAVRREQEISQETPGRSVRDVLDQIADEARGMWPALFKDGGRKDDDDEPPVRDNPRRSGASGVLPSNDRRGPPSTSMRFSKLPREAQETFKRLQKQMATRGVKYTEAEYLEEYMEG